MRNRDAVLQLIRAHFQSEPSLTEAYFFERNGVVHLLEVNAAALPSGAILPFGFRPTKDTPFAVVMADVTPDEAQAIHDKKIPLPEGWDLSDADHVSRAQLINEAV